MSNQDSHSLDLVVELDHVSKVYGHDASRVVALDDTILHVERGEMVVIMGPSGSGKTTLIQIIGALLSPTTGCVKINGTDLGELSGKKLSKLRLRDIGFIFQNPNLLAALTARRNVELVLNLNGIKGDLARETALRLLDRVGLSGRTRHLPAELSGGEQQRVAIARALANSPSLILADEPTANLDSKTGHKIIEMMKDITKTEERTVIIATHDLRIRDVADRVLWLEDGRLSSHWSNGYAIDPVCLMLIGKLTKTTSEVEEDVYHFCSESCMREFTKDPQKYIERSKLGRISH